MKKYQIFVQDNFYKVIQSDDVSSLVVRISIDIKNNLVSDFDYTKPANIKIVPLS